MTEATRDPGADRAEVLRSALVDELRARRMITDAAVEAAFRATPRERFLPGDVALDVAYGVDCPVVTKRDEYGVPVSSVSAAYIQARMLEQAELRPGMTVLEIGSGGLNAAYLAEIVGEKGSVVSVDIDAEVTDRAARLLAEAGYAGRVTLMTLDASRGVPGAGPFDAIIVTVGAWDIAPAWLDALAGGGVLVLPLIMNGITRTIGFRRDRDHLVSTSIEVAGFVAMQGDGRHAAWAVPLADPRGGTVTLRFDTEPPGDLSPLDGVLAAERTEAWSGATIGHHTSFADLHLWFAWFLPGYCLLAVDDGTRIAAEGGSWFPSAVVRGSAFAHLTVRPALDGTGREFGARAYGRDGERAATAMVEQIRAWDRHGRHTSPAFDYRPRGRDLARIPAGAAVLDKTYGILTIRWPAPAR